jgi:hypothetical protein
MASVGDLKASPSERSAPFGTASLLRHVPLFILPALAIAVLSLIAWTSLAYDIPVHIFTRDMAVLAALHPFAAIRIKSRYVSHVCDGNVLSIRGFCRARDRPGDTVAHLGRGPVFTLSGGGRLFYEFHDRLFPRYFGIPQQLVHASIATTAAAITFRWWRHFLAFRPSLLAAALFFLSLSLAMDLFDGMLLKILPQWQFFWEDGAKFIGISLWATLFHGPGAAHAFPIVTSPDQCTGAVVP